VVIAGEVVIGAREMRTMGIEAAYPIRASTLDAPTGGDLSAADVSQAAVRVARSWRW
jgi:glycerate kinase